MKKWLKYGLIGGIIGFVVSLILFFSVMYCPANFSTLNVPEGSFEGVFDNPHIFCKTVISAFNNKLIFNSWGYTIIGILIGLVIYKIKYKKKELPQ